VKYVKYFQAVVLGVAYVNQTPMFNISSYIYIYIYITFDASISAAPFDSQKRTTFYGIAHSDFGASNYNVVPYI
jgi:hypothetical protein